MWPFWRHHAGAAVVSVHVIGGLLLQTGHAIGVNSHWWFLAANDHAIGGNTHWWLLTATD